MHVHVSSNAIVTSLFLDLVILGSSITGGAGFLIVAVVCVSSVICRKVHNHQKGTGPSSSLVTLHLLCVHISNFSIQIW